jgi:pimeloyl-ACP methyl ester carboxylesterase
MPATGYDLDTLADDVAAIIEQRDLRDVTLVTHSMG